MDKLLTHLQKSSPGQITNVSGLRPPAVALFAARCQRELNRPLLLIAPNEDMAASLERDLQIFTSATVLNFPSYDIPPYTPLSPDPHTVAARLATLYQMAEGHSRVMVIAADALLRRIAPVKLLDSLAEPVERGEDLDRDDLVAKLQRSGYEHVSLVQNSGEFTVRGGIIDIFPPPFAIPGHELFDAPLRLDFFGDTVESIRYFDPISQRSLKEIDETIILPVSDILFPASEDERLRITARFTELAEREQWAAEPSRKIEEYLGTGCPFPGIEFFLPLFYQGTDTVLDVVGRDTVIIEIDALSQQQSLQLVRERIDSNHAEAVAGRQPALNPAHLFVTEEELADKLASFSRLQVHDFISPDQETITISCGNHTLLKQDLDLRRRKEGLITPLVDHIQTLQEQGHQAIITCRSQRHLGNLHDILSQHGLTVQARDLPLTEPGAVADQVVLLPESLSRGFDLPLEKIHFFSETELFGEKQLAPRSRRKHPAAGESVSFDQLAAGELVVHATHGIGIYQGIVNMTHGTVSNDFLHIEFKDNDKLYVPIDRLNMVSKYKGLTDKKPKIDALGGKAWAKTKSKVKEAVWKVAQDLLKLYAKRQVAEGHAFSAPGELFHELTESFPYDETDGQLGAINSCLDDLTSPRTMDRLVCGDVGYGKTEVAIRAAFKVVEDGYQVAVLVPTTVLAEQHAESFRERFSGFPVRVESLNRFRSTKEQKEIIRDTGHGRVDVVIGTHRLLSKDVVFNRLGLLIIDEEHRFGVAHKEKLKKLRHNVDVLTLTATPIPRTLQLSLLGVRDLSVISSPPRHRRSVKTFVARHDDLVIKEAVIKEMQRGGQVFLVHNRVQSIHEIATRLQKLVPEARVAVAHGQMPGKTLEEIMVDFVGHRIDVLVCTTIIESGLDIPNANTIIITRADRLGLAGIYQLRGRVGRSRQQAYAYLLVPSLDGLSKDAKQRLRALMDYNELGGGFKLAMSDLQIRGGGNILGESQSGNIAAVGYDLYLDLLQRTVEDLKRRGLDDTAGTELPDFEPEINLQLSALIPSSYIPDGEQRYIAYRKISSLSQTEQLADLRDELVDRYGAIPAATENLLEIIELKIAMRPLCINKLDQGPGTLAFSFLDETPVLPEQILLMVRTSKGNMRLTPDNRLVVTTSTRSAEAIFAAAKKVLQLLRADDI
ncbi:MAG: transcription-repair coupling factor [Desulfobulbaceae bacterium]|mgnify:CR=1 FL=1|nr:MAG: transcription-repair coupling factor [Desulfobulbaceae bacterium]